MEMKATYKRRAVFVPYCMVAPGFQANSHIQCNYEWRKEFINFLLEEEIDMIPFSCVEASFAILADGLLRDKHGIDYYQKLTGFCEHCDDVASQEADRLMQMMKAGIQIVAILGIEHSPSCAVNYLYTHNGTQKRAGIFMQLLIEKLQKRGITTNYIGINRKYPKKALLRLKECICNN